MRKLSGPDGILRHRTHMVHSLLRRKILQQGGERHEADSQGKGLSCHGHLLHPDPPCDCIHKDSSRRRTGNHKGWRQHIRLHHQHDAPDRPASAKQPLRSRSRALRILRLHHRLEHVRGACPTQDISRACDLLSCAVAPLYKISLIPGGTRNEADEILTGYARAPKRGLMRRGWQRQTP